MALVGLATRVAWCQSKLLNGKGVRWPGISRPVSNSGHAEMGSSMSSLSPGAHGCTSDQQRPLLEQNTSMVTARAVGFFFFFFVIV